MCSSVCAIASGENCVPKGFALFDMKKESNFWEMLVEKQDPKNASFGSVFHCGFLGI